MKVRVLALLLLTRIASADTRIGWYAETSVRVGPVWGESRSSNGYIQNSDAVVFDGRLALGGELGGGGLIRTRLGAVIDMFKAIDGYGEGVAVGIEGQADTELVACWRIGLRLSGSLGDAGGAPAGGDGQVVMAGLRVRNHVASFGIDGMFVRRGEDGDRGFVNGVLLGAGLDGRPGKYSLAVAGGATVLGLTIGAIALVINPPYSH